MIDVRSPVGRGWHSVVEVRPYRPIDDWSSDALGAFVHVLAIAYSPSQFKELVCGRLFDDGFTVIGWDEVYEFDLTTDDWKSDEASELHAFLNDQHPVQYSRFDTYPEEGSDG